MPVDRSPPRGDNASYDPATGQPPVNRPPVPDNPGTSRAAGPLIDLGDDFGGAIHATRLVKLPPFWKENPALWFTQCEAAFALSHVTADQTKFRYVIVALDPAVLPFVSDIIADPPEGDKYLTLKTRIINTFDDTAETKLRRLLRDNEFSDEKPSYFLQRLRNLAGGQCGDAVLRTLFLEQLPIHVRSILAISECTDLTKLASQADKIVDLSKPTTATVSVGNEQPTYSRDDDLRKAVDALTYEVSQLRAQGKQRDGRRPRSRSRSTRRYGGAASNRRTQGIGDYCYYHDKFGKDARKCRSPCKWIQPQEN